MAPDATDSPSHSLKLSEVSLITRAISTQLVSPKARQLMLPSWKTPSVPEVAINKNGNVKIREHNIGTSGERPIVTLVSNLSRSQLSLYQPLERTVL
jgi:hypothetical protein